MRTVPRPCLRPQFSPSRMATERQRPAATPYPHFVLPAPRQPLSDDPVLTTTDHEWLCRPRRRGRRRGVRRRGRARGRVVRRVIATLLPLVLAVPETMSPTFGSNIPPSSTAPDSSPLGPSHLCPPLAFFATPLRRVHLVSPFAPSPFATIPCSSSLAFDDGRGAPPEISTQSATRRWRCPF